MVELPDEGGERDADHEEVELIPEVREVLLDAQRDDLDYHVADVDAIQHCVDGLDDVECVLVLDAEVDDDCQQVHEDHQQDEQIVLVACDDPVELQSLIAEAPERSPHRK